MSLRTFQSFILLYNETNIICLKGISVNIDHAIMHRDRVRSCFVGENAFRIYQAWIQLD